MENGSMLEVLEEVERRFRDGILYNHPDHWKTLYIDYHPPVVERLWTSWGHCRIYLHRIFPCSRKEALWHPHPWPSAVKILSGSYEMGVGFGKGQMAPPLASLVRLSAGSSYEMTNPDGWHFVRPIGGPSFSIMVSGLPWGREFPQPEEPLKPLTPRQITEIMSFFGKEYPL